MTNALRARDCIEVSYRIVLVLKTQAFKSLCVPITYFDTITNQFWLKLLFPVPVISHLKLYYISWLLQNLSKLFLKLLTELELTTCTGKLFHIFMILWVNTCLHVSYLEKFLTYFQVLPLVTESWHIGKTGETAVSCIPCKILYVSIMSPLCRQYLSVGMPKTLRSSRDRYNI